LIGAHLGTATVAQTSKSAVSRVLTPCFSGVANCVIRNTFPTWKPAIQLPTRAHAGNGWSAGAFFSGWRKSGNCNRGIRIFQQPRFAHPAHEPDSGRDIALRCPRPRSSGRNHCAAERGADGAARRPYPVQGHNVHTGSGNSLLGGRASVTTNFRTSLITLFAIKRIEDGHHAPDHAAGT
jgi:hypothetical protein